MRRGTAILLSTLLLSQLAGCALLHNLQPHRLRMLNRGPAPSLDPDFMTQHSEQATSPLVAGDEGRPFVVRAQQ